MTQARTERWLARHGAVDRGATPLLRARLDARRRGEILSTVVTATAFLAYVAWNAIVEVPADRPEPLYSWLVFCAVLALTAVAALWVQGRADHRIGAGLTCRVAHPTAITLRAVVGPWFVTTTVLGYAGGALVGALVSLGTNNPHDRAAGLVLVGAVLAFALIGSAGLAEVIRRPAVADDVESLVDDALLRREDALRVVQPFPAVAAVVAGVNSEGDLALFGFLGYAFVAMATWTFAYGAATHASVGEPPAVPGHRAKPAA